MHSCHFRMALSSHSRFTRQHRILRAEWFWQDGARGVELTQLCTVRGSYKLNLYMPISKLDANMETAHENDAATKEKFYFRACRQHQRQRQRQHCFPTRLRLSDTTCTHGGISPVSVSCLAVFRCQPTSARPLRVARPRLS